jgi:mRNA interferase MazF
MCQRPARGRNKCFERVPALTPAGSKICLRLNIRRVSQRGPRVIPTGEPPSAQMKQNILEPLKIITCFLSPSQRKPAACAYPMAGRSLEAVRSEKLRPAIVLADARRSDWVLCQITSQPYGDPDAIRLETGDFERGTLRLTSYARPGKLFTAHITLIAGQVADLRPTKFTAVRDAVIRMIKS